MTKKAAIKKGKTRERKETGTKDIHSTRNAAFRLSLALVVGVFIILAFFAHRAPYFPLDLVITRSIQFFHPFWFNFLMIATSFIGYTPQVSILVLLIVGVMFLIGLRFEATVAFCNALGVTITNLILKDIIGRPRPSIDLVRVFSPVGQFSFPSGHVMFYLAFFGYLWFLTFTRGKDSVLRLLFLIPLSAAILLIGPSRIYLGAHWASDVFGAYLLGSVWLVLLIQFHNWGKSRFFVKQPLSAEKRKDRKLYRKANS